MSVFQLLRIPLSSSSSSPSPSAVHPRGVGPTFSAFLRCPSSSSSSSSSSSLSVCGRVRCRLPLRLDSDEDEDLLPEEFEADEAAFDRFHVLGLGQAMVDFSGMVEDRFLEKVGVEKGSRKVVNHEERGRVLRAMDGCAYKAAAGGSLSNTLVALARLGSSTLSVAMAGSVGSDPLGGFFRNKLSRANVRFVSDPIPGATTGTVIVLTTPDAQRTMLSYPGTSSELCLDHSLGAMISRSNILVVEGYLFELPDTIETLKNACREASRGGALVAVTASDVSCIRRHYDHFWEIVGGYADIVFANSSEAQALCGDGLGAESGAAAARYLSQLVPLVSVTDGARGSYIGVRGEAVYIPPWPCVAVDTCGAGDAYASGILYAMLQHRPLDLPRMGALASRIAATVVGQQGTRLRVQDAAQLAQSYATDHISSF